MRWVWRLLLCFSVLVAECIVALKFSSVTESVRLTDAYGKIVDFADFNADKATDILVQNGAGQLTCQAQPHSRSTPLPQWAVTPQLLVAMHVDCHMYNRLAILGHSS